MTKHKNLLNIIFIFGLAVFSAGAGIACRAEPPVITLLTVTPSEINNGASSTLKWEVVGTTKVTIDQGVGEVPASGTKQLSPSQTTAYTVTASNTGGTVTRSVVLYVAEATPPPVAPAVDTEPPLIKDVAASSETEDSAVISWTTNEPATSVVDYGTAADYGSTASSDQLTIEHSLTVTGLQPNTAYHFRVTSVDKAGNEASSVDDLFVTAQEKSSYSVALISEEWGRDTEMSDINIPGTTVEGKKYLYVKGQLQNRSQATLRAVIMTMNCWSGSNIVKYEVYVYRGPSLPGQVFSFNIQTADDPSVDNVTVDFADSLGRPMNVIQEP
jgi:hypothetical protein